jgi:hypothetical protein
MADNPRPSSADVFSPQPVTERAPADFARRELEHSPSGETSPAATLDDWQPVAEHGHGKTSHHAPQMIGSRSALWNTARGKTSRRSSNKERCPTSPWSMRSSRTSSRS